ncbi:barstar family protein (plasmid) [Embleya sp. NBC_00888]|uniref:barstar family protein n=1 Tax=Embleya sp. NBC_00888 TaxID=2975960 RepID=UPI002F90E849|nr:barstar family protein [Embleya sp. NBC_00888]
MDEGTDHRGHHRYTLIGTEHGHPLGVCSVVEGLFTDPGPATYELFGWVPDASGPHGWIGSRVWLVPDDDALDAWCLDDAAVVEHSSRAESLVLTGVDDCMGPPEGHRGAVRVHDGSRWLGSCREFARILRSERPLPSLVLRGLAPADELRALLARGTRRARDLDEVLLEIRDDRGELLAAPTLWASVEAWRPSAHGADLIDLDLARHHTLVPEHAEPVWERWFAGPPDTLNAWAGLDTRLREAWFDLVRHRACIRRHSDRPAGHAYELDGRHATEEQGLYLALGEAVNGPGGYFGGNLQALHECLGGTFGYSRPATLLWRDAAMARTHLSHALSPDGQPYDFLTEVLDVLADGGMHVTLA